MTMWWCIRVRDAVWRVFDCCYEYDYILCLCIQIQMWILLATLCSAQTLQIHIVHLVCLYAISCFGALRNYVLRVWLPNSVSIPWIPHTKTYVSFIENGRRRRQRCQWKYYSTGCFNDFKCIWFFSIFFCFIIIHRKSNIIHLSRNSAQNKNLFITFNLTTEQSVATI